MLKLYLIRHGESENNKYNFEFVGGIAKDTALTEDGKRQAEALGNRLKDKRIEGTSFDKIYSSTAVRAAKTADISLSHAGYDLSDLKRTDYLLETDRGDMVGMNRRDVINFFKQPNINSWTYQPTNGESNQMSGYRMYNYLKSELDGFNYDGKVAVFGHGNIFRSFAKIIMDNYPCAVEIGDVAHSTWDDMRRLHVHNTSITHLTYDGKDWTINSWNDFEHLKKDGLVRRGD